VSAVLGVLSTALVLSFVMCCVLSGLLQVLAWSRHARQGAPVTLRALRHPEQYFDPVGLRQMLLARKLLTVGGAAYLSYGFLIVVSNFL
jgi:hypothetical protein